MGSRGDVWGSLENSSLSDQFSNLCPGIRKELFTMTSSSEAPGPEINSTPALKVLRERVVRASEKGYIKGLDGRKIWIRSGHAALNFLLQGAGAIVMKKALTILNNRAIMEGLDYKFVGNIHDEFQTEVLESHAERFGELAVDSIKEAGQYYELRCPLDAEAKIGNNWAETH